MSHEFLMPGKIYYGNGALEMSREQLKKQGKKALVVAGPSMIKYGSIKKLTDILEEEEVSYEIFSGITGEPTDVMIEEGLKLYQNTGCDYLIALGGGSPMDAMKAIAALTGNGGSISDYMGKEIGGDIPPMIAIPTTAGTGSEATQFTIITDTKKDVKMLLRGKALMPDIAIVDPSFTITASPVVTAAPGLDALTHAVEAYTSKKANAMTDVYAISAIKRIMTYLPICYKDGNNVEAREMMALASFEAGVAFNNASVTLVHGMSRPIGALFHVPHGMSNAMLLPACLAFAKDGAATRFATLGREIGVADPKESDDSAADKFIQAICDICKVCEIPTLEEYGINKDAFFAVIDKMAADALASGSPGNTRKEVTTEDMAAIYRRLWTA